MRKILPEILTAITAALWVLWIAFLTAYQTPAHAQAASAPAIAGCSPNTWASPWSTAGSKLLDVKTDAALGKMTWCKQASGVGVQNDAGWWWPILYQWCLLKTGTTNECIDPKQGWSYKAALNRVLAASSPDDAILAIRIEFAAASVEPRNDVEKWEIRRLRFEGCRALIASTVRPPAASASSPSGFTNLTPAWCAGYDPGAKPVAPVLSAYVVTGNAAYPVSKNAAGAWVRSVVAIPQKPTLGDPCFPEEADASQFGVRWYAVHIVGVTQPIVAGCSPRKQ